MALFWFKSRWNFFFRVQSTICQHCSDNGLVLNRWQTIRWTNDGQNYWHTCITQPRWVNIFMKFQTGQLNLTFSIVMRPTLSSLAVPQVIITTTRVARDDKVGIMITAFSGLFCFLFFHKLFLKWTQGTALYIYVLLNWIRLKCLQFINNTSPFLKFTLPKVPLSYAISN